MGVKYKTYKRGNIQFYIDANNKVYFKTHYQTIRIVRQDRSIYKNDQSIQLIISAVKSRSIKDMESLHKHCRYNHLTWESVSGLPCIP